GALQREELPVPPERAQCGDEAQEAALPGARAPSARGRGPLGAHHPARSDRQVHELQDPADRHAAAQGPVPAAGGSTAEQVLDVTARDEIGALVIAVALGGVVFAVQQSSQSPSTVHGFQPAPATASGPSASADAKPLPTPRASVAAADKAPAKPSRPR